MATSRHTHASCNAVLLVWGSLRLIPIMADLHQLIRAKIRMVSKQQHGIGTGMELEWNWNRNGTGTRVERNPKFDSQRLHWFSLSGSFGGQKREGWPKARECPRSATGDGGRVLVLCVYEQVCVWTSMCMNKYSRTSLIWPSNLRGISLSL